jgi:DNA-binding transcriptional LysR family regulator
LWLIPRLPSFTNAHPGIDVRIDATTEWRELAVEGLDLAIRYGRVNATQGTLLFRESTLPVCSPELVRDKSRPLADPSDLRLHTLLQVTIPPGSSVPLESVLRLTPNGNNPVLPPEYPPRKTQARNGWNRTYRSLRCFLPTLLSPLHLLMALSRNTQPVE